MIGYVTLGSNDLARAGAFYDALLAEIGAKRVMDFPTAIVWSIGLGAPALSVMKPFDGNPATVGNGVMVGLAAASPEQVRRLHARALELGGRDEGAPGPRPSGFYVGYFRDLDGNKLNWFCPGQAQP